MLYYYYNTLAVMMVRTDGKIKRPTKQLTLVIIKNDNNNININLVVWSRAKTRGGGKSTVEKPISQGWSDA